MKFLFSLLTLTLLLQCKAQRDSGIEADIFLVPLASNIDSNWNIVLKDTSNAIRFSKDFWDYLITSHPKTSSLLFISPLHDTSNDYEALGDSSLRYYNIARLNSYYFISLLADSAGGSEKEIPFSGTAFFEATDKDSKDVVKGKEFDEGLNDYKMSPAMRTEFTKLKEILTWKDTTQHYIMFFKKEYVKNIYKLYE